MIKELANGLVQVATAGKFKVEINPEFTDAMEKIKSEERNLATRIYDSGTMFIIDDDKHVMISKLLFVKSNVLVLRSRTNCARKKA